MCLLRLLYPLIVFLIVTNVYSLNYVPIHLEDWEHATGIRRRDDSRSDVFDPTWRAELMYGYPKDEKTILFGNWTLIAPPGLPIVMLERFAPLTKSVDCKGDNGHISLTFKSRDAFRRALEAWSFINHRSAGHRFLLIANHAGCGPEDGRHPYIITKIREEPTTLTTHLTSTLVGWNQVAHAYSFHWGEATLPQLSVQRKRSYEFLFPNDQNAWILPLGRMTQQLWKTIGDIHHKSTNKGNPYKIDVEKKMLFFVSTPNLLINCVSCYLKTSILSTGTIEKDARDLMPKASTATASFSNLDTSMELDIKSNSDNPFQDSDHRLVLGSGGVGPAGVQAGPIKIGLTWEIVAAIRYRVVGATQARVSFGGGFIGHSALVTADFVNPSNRRNTGWDHFKHKATKGQFKQLSHEMTLRVGITSSLKFGFELPNLGQLDLSIDIPIPQVKAVLKSLRDQDGICKTMKNRKNGFHLEGFATAVQVFGTARFQLLSAPMKYQDLPLFKLGQYKFLDYCLPASSLKLSSLQEYPDNFVADAGDRGDTADDSQLSGTLEVAENPPDPGTLSQGDDNSQDPNTAANSADQPVKALPVSSASNQVNDVELAQLPNSNQPDAGDNTQLSDEAQSPRNSLPIPTSGAPNDQNGPSVPADGSSDVDQTQINNLSSDKTTTPKTDQTQPNNVSLDQDLPPNTDQTETPAPTQDMPNIATPSERKTTANTDGNDIASQPNEDPSTPSILPTVRRIRRQLVRHPHIVPEGWRVFH